MNKNSIFGWASFILTLLGIALILLGVLKYPDYAIGFSVVGVGFIAICSYWEDFPKKQKFHGVGSPLGTLFF